MLRSAVSGRASPRAGLHGLLLLAPLLWACSDNGPTSSDPPPTTEIIITPSAPIQFSSLRDTIRLKTETRDAKGGVTKTNVAWHTSDATVASISADGLVTAVGNGTATLTATAEKAVATLGVTVKQSAAALHIIAGDTQSDTVMATLPIPLAVQALDARDNAIAGQIVEFRLRGDSIARSATTDREGKAAVSWVLGSETGVIQIDASLADADGGGVTFTATALPGALDQLEIAGGGDQRGRPGSALAEAIVVRAIDAYGNAKPNARIDFVPVLGGGTVTVVTATTNDEGVALTRWTLGDESVQQFVLVASPALADTLLVTASVDLTNAVFIVLPDGMQAGTPTHADVYISLSEEGKERRGAILADLSWEGVELEPISLLVQEGDEAEAALVGPTTVRVVTSRAQNQAPLEPLFRVEFHVPSNAAGLVKFRVAPTTLIGAGTFNDLLPGVFSVGAVQLITNR